MRLNPFNPSSVRVQRSGGGRGARAGGIGCGGIIIVIIGALVFGADPGQMLGTMEQMQGGNSAPAESASGADDGNPDECYDNQYATETCNVLGSLNETWQPIFNQAGVRFQQPLLTFIQGNVVSTACGTTSSEVGPFYCPGDQSINIDVRFYDQMDRQLGARGDFARYYVVAHEYGHHIQTLTGVSSQIRSLQQANPRQANQLQVMMELHADCYAGVWAGKNRNLIEPGDFEEGMNAAAAIGDDRLTGGRVSPENFTHGTSQQRMQALRLGMQSADDNQCDQILQVS